MKSNERHEISQRWREVLDFVTGLKTWDTNGDPGGEGTKPMFAYILILTNCISFLNFGCPI